MKKELVFGLGIGIPVVILVILIGGNFQTDLECKSNIESKQYDQAIICYNSYLQSNPSDTSAMGFLAGTYEYVRDYDSALSIYQKIIELEPENTTGLGGMGKIYELNGDCEKATMFYEKALSFDPENIDAKIFFKYADRHDVICK